MTDTSIDERVERYYEFLKGKISLAPDAGFEPPTEASPSQLKPHQIDICNWAIRKGRAAIFAQFGLGKTRVALQLMKWVHEQTGGKTLIVAPLGVRQEFTRNDGPAMGMKVVYCRTDAEVETADTPYIITNYERVREGDITVSNFAGSILDESSALRSFGSKTTQTFFDLFKAVPYRFVATATPSPNEYKELTHYAHYLGVLDSGNALTRWFQRDGKQAGHLTLMPHMEGQFWLWLASWAMFLSKPSDLGHSDEGYDLPPIKIHWHRVDIDYKRAWNEIDGWGQAKLFPDAGGGLKDAAHERSQTMRDRVQAALDIVRAEPEKHWIIWHDLEAERHLIEKLMPEAVTVYGSQDLEKREDAIVDFSNGKFPILAVKPSIAGSGCNFQRHCSDAIFCGPSYKFNDILQAVHRIYRFLQTKQVNIHFVYAETQSSEVDNLKRKWAQHDELIEKMQHIVKKYGLNHSAMKMSLERTLGCDRVAVSGDGFTVVNNDTVPEAMRLKSDSMDMILTSIPFSKERTGFYEYTPSFNDFGFNPGAKPFFDQMDFLIPEWLRVLKPGRIAAIHTKDSVEYGTVSELGMYSVYAFSDDVIRAMKRHGFVFMGRITIDTDVVRENAQTYRLGWGENAKDSTKMGCGSAEYVLLFRKWHPSMSPTGNAYGPEPVTKDNDEYTRARWQIHASEIWRESGDRLLDPDFLKTMKVEDIREWWIRYSTSKIYDYEEHVKLCEIVDEAGHLPASWMLFAPHSQNPDIWTDIHRINTLNSEQSRKVQEQHVCLSRGSLILTRDSGFKPIEEIEVGEHLLTHEGRWKPVIAKRCTGVNPVIQVKAQGVGNLVLTPNHKLWTRKASKKACEARQTAKKASPEWVPAEETKGSYVNLKLPPVVEESNHDAWEWKIIGRWLADGHISSRNTIHISCGDHKLEELLLLLGDRGGFIQDTGTSKQVLVRDKDGRLRNTLAKCGHGAANKQLPPEAYSLPPDLARALLDGYLSGDGHYVESRKKWTASSVSRALLLGLAMLVQRAFGTVASVYAGRPAGTTTIEGRTVTTKQDWVFCFNAEKDFSPFIEDDGAWKKVRSVDLVGEAETWSLQVEGDASYTAEGCIVKNCPLQLSVIQRLIERFTNPGDVVYEPFAGIGSTCYQALKMGRKTYGVELNPNYFRYAVGYCERATEKLETPTLFDLAEFTAKKAS